jgi:hypothetical protein
MTTTDRDFSTYRRRPHYVDILTPKRVGVEGYRLKAARNFDGVFETIITADIGRGYLDPSINPQVINTAPGNKHVRFIFDPDTFQAPHAADLLDDEHIWLQFFPVDFLGAEGTGGAKTLLLPDDEMKAAGRVTVTGEAPNAATVANSLRLDMPFRMRNLTIRNNEASTIAASGTLSLAGGLLPLNTETVVIGSKTYMFQTILTNVDGHVLIGGTALESLANLISAITLGAGVGVKYAALTTLHPSVTAATGTGDAITVTAKTPGIDGNLIATTETLTNGSWGAGTLLGGVNSGGGTTLYVTFAEGAAEMAVAPQELVEFFDGGVGTLMVRGDGTPVTFTATMTHYLPL